MGEQEIPLTAPLSSLKQVYPDMVSETIKNMSVEVGGESVIYVP